jgi:Peptidase_C39 like family
MTHNKVPFFGNTKDDTHCYQACLKMVLKYFEPKVSYSFKYLDKITDKETGKPTWPVAGLVWLAENNFEIRQIEDFDYEKYTKSGIDYIYEKFGSEVGDYASKTDIARNISWTKEFIKKCIYEDRQPSFEDIQNLLDEGYLIIAHVNYRSLYNKDGYVGHKVVVVGCDKDRVTIHDPGLPPKPNNQISVEQFTKGWEYPKNSFGELTAIRIKT